MAHQERNIYEVLDEIEGKIFNIRVSNATADFKLASEVVKHSLEYAKEKVLIRREFGDKRVKRDKTIYRDNSRF